MKLSLALLLVCSTLGFAAVGPSGGGGTVIPGGSTNVALLNGTNVFTGTNTFNTNLIFGSSTLQTQIDSKPTVALTNVARLDQANNLTAANTITNSGNTISAASYGSAQQTLTYSTGTNITVDASKALHFVSLTNTTYFAQPTGLAVGASFTVHLMQDSTGVRAVTFNTNYWRFPGGLQPTITTNANSYSVLSCVACPFGTNVFAVPALNFQ